MWHFDRHCESGLYITTTNIPTHLVVSLGQLENMENWTYWHLKDLMCPSSWHTESHFITTRFRNCKPLDRCSQRTKNAKSAERKWLENWLFDIQKPNKVEVYGTNMIRVGELIVLSVIRKEMKSIWIADKERKIAFGVLGFFQRTKAGIHRSMWWKAAASGIAPKVQGDVVIMLVRTDS